MDISREQILAVLLVASVVALLCCMGYCGKFDFFEGLEDKKKEDKVTPEPKATVHAAVASSPKEEDAVVEPSAPLGENEVFMKVGDESSPYGLTGGKVPVDCFPKDQLNPDELLPGDDSSKFAQENPSGSGSLKDKNFLEAGFHIGVNTVGQSLRNANRQLRSDPPNPQVKVSPWLNSTIEPDTNRRPLEIGGCA